MSRGKAFVDVIKGAMEPLARRYGLRVASEESDLDYAAVSYTNDTTGLKVAIDWTELRPFLTVYELVGGAFPPEPTQAGIRGVRRRAFDVDDLLLLRPVESTPVGKMFSRRDQQAATPILADYARALEQQAPDVFSGDFTVFDQLDDIVTQREHGLREKG